MSQSTISTFQLFEMFPDEETARKYLEDRLWPLGAICPQCKSGTRVIVRPNGFYRCNACKKFTFSIRTGTIFGRSKIPLHKWVYAMYLLVTSRKGNHLYNSLRFEDQIRILESRIDTLESQV
jgi:Transposase zinc-ribbon domain